MMGRFSFLHLFFISIILEMTFIYFRYSRFMFSGNKGSLLFSVFLFSPVAVVFVFFSLNLNGKSGPLSDLLAWYAYLGLGFLSFLFFLVLLRDGVVLPCRIIQKITGISPSVLTYFSDSCVFRNNMVYFLTFIAITLSLTGVYKAHKTPETREYIIQIPGLHEGLHGFTIVQISDIHLGPTLKKSFLKKIVKRVNELDADTVVLTGDLVDGFVDRLEKEIKPLENIRSAYGNYFVTGNHEYYFGALDWIEAVKKTGFTVLVNSFDLIEKNGGKIAMAGVPDLYGGTFVADHKPDPFAAIKGAPFSSVKILLSHQPLIADKAAEAGFHFQISGHTHGGQLFPWNYIVALQQHYIAGLYDHNGLKLYVSRGTGYWGPPMRLFAPSEITKFVLAGS